MACSSQRLRLFCCAQGSTGCWEVQAGIASTLYQYKGRTTHLDDPKAV